MPEARSKGYGEAMVRDALQTTYEASGTRTKAGYRSICGLDAIRPRSSRDAC
jgi:hypothetical protein